MRRIVYKRPDKCPECGSNKVYSDGLSHMPGDPTKPSDVILCSQCGTTYMNIYEYSKTIISIYKEQKKWVK